MQISFQLVNWSGLLASHGEVNSELPAQFSKQAVSELDLSHLKPMQKRRLSKYAKMSLASIQNLAEEINDKTELVFSSRHGDFHRTNELLTDLAREEPLSPTSFSLSVHNAVTGLYSIFNEFKGPITTVSAGNETFQSALIEAYIRLQNATCQQVLLVHVDQVLPEDYLIFADETQVDHCCVLLLKKGLENNLGQSITVGVSQTINAELSPKPAAVMFLNFLHSEQALVEYSSRTKTWVFEKQ